MTPDQQESVRRDQERLRRHVEAGWIHHTGRRHEQTSGTMNWTLGHLTFLFSPETSFAILIQTNSVLTQMPHIKFASKAQPDRAVLLMLAHTKRLEIAILSQQSKWSTLNNVVCILQTTWCYSCTKNVSFKGSGMHDASFSADSWCRNHSLYLGHSNPLIDDTNYNNKITTGRSRTNPRRWKLAYSMASLRFTMARRGWAHNAWERTFHESSQHKQKQRLVLKKHRSLEQHSTLKKFELIFLLGKKKYVIYERPQVRTCNQPNWKKGPREGHC